MQLTNPNLIAKIKGTEYEHYNHATGNMYTGLDNIASLTATRNKEGLKSNRWLTFVQARDKGLKIKKGSKGTYIFKGYGIVTEVIEKDGEDKTVTRSRPLGGAYVFNLDHTEPIKP